MIVRPRTSYYSAAFAAYPHGWSFSGIDYREHNLVDVEGVLILVFIPSTLGRYLGDSNPSPLIQLGGSDTGIQDFWALSWMVFIDFSEAAAMR